MFFKFTSKESFNIRRNILLKYVSPILRDKGFTNVSFSDSSWGKVNSDIYAYEFGRINRCSTFDYIKIYICRGDNYIVVLIYRNNKRKIILINGNKFKIDGITYVNSDNIWEKQFN